MHVALLFLSAGATMAPWQWHCLEVAGHLVPTVIAPPSELDSGFGTWARTWFNDEDDLVYWDHPEQLATAPQRAFRSPAERVAITRLALDNSPNHGSRFDAELRGVTAARMRERPLEVLARSSLRAGRLWTWMRSISHVDAQWIGRASWRSFAEDRVAVGEKRALLRLAKALASTCFEVVYVAYTVLCGWVAIRACRRADAWAIAVTAGTIAYTLISAYTALGEARRNIPFLFLLLPLAVDRQMCPARIDPL